MSSLDNQKWNPEQYGKTARFVSDLGMPVVDLLAPRTGESILDLGCGDGALTGKLVEMGCRVVGVDSSPEMIAAARASDLNAFVADGCSLEFKEEFDAVFSNAALHWMPNPKSVIDGVWRALKPVGRFVGEFGGYGNVSTILSAMENSLSLRGVIPAKPWFFPRPEEYRTLLEDRGFRVEYIELIPRPTSLPGHVSDWLATFAQPHLTKLPESDRKDLIAEVVEAVRPALCDADGKWRADYVRLRFSARKSA